MTTTAVMMTNTTSSGNAKSWFPSKLVIEAYFSFQRAQKLLLDSLARTTSSQPSRNTKCMYPFPNAFKKNLKNGILGESE